ncbi:hypothetical protein NOF04DRAFT_1053612 [Fusarium oxysporum II5]|nr:hypothetical protein NOF04DRAFT_1053612 [Fusarium oxysporum II5]
MIVLNVFLVYFFGLMKASFAELSTIGAKPIEGCHSTVLPGAAPNHDNIQFPSVWYSPFFVLRRVVKSFFVITQ